MLGPVNTGGDGMPVLAGTFIQLTIPYGYMSTKSGGGRVRLCQHLHHAVSSI
jgi:hypothetical protein